MDKQSRFIDPRTDFGFKRIFSDEEILLAFLNDLFEGETHFKSLTCADKESKGFSSDNKTIIYDIRCITDDDKHIIIEMQNDGNDSFRDRMLYYTARDIAMQGKAGKGWNYENLDAVYSIFVLNFMLFKDKDSSQFLRHDIKLIDVTTNKQFSDKMRMICLQLPLTNTDEPTKTTKLGSWMYNLYNMYKMQNLAYTEEMPIFKKMEQLAEYSNLSAEERITYERSYKAWLDEYNRNARHARIEEQYAKIKEQTARIEEQYTKIKEQYAKVEEQAANAYDNGVKEGIAETQRKTAKQLKDLGMDFSTISSITSLTVNEIEQL